MKMSSIWQCFSKLKVSTLPILRVRAILTCPGFNEFIHERETKRSDDPTIKLFDEVILAKRNRGKSSFFGKSRVDFLSDTSDHLWRTAAANPPSSRFPGDYRSIITRSKTYNSFHFRS
jgi:hypothetical protein